MTVNLLDRAARRLGPIARETWTEAYFLHVNGFYEVRIDITGVRDRVPIIKALIREVEKLLNQES